MKFFLNALIVIFIISGINLNAEGRLVFGFVLDSATKSPIPGARINILNTTKGTYGSARGQFRLNVPQESVSLKVSSLGYKNKIFKVNSKDDSITIFLSASAINLGQVNVIANIDPRTVMQRVIAKKSENASRIKTFSGLLYTKMDIIIGGSLASSISNDGKNTSISISSGGDSPKNQMLLTETFSNTVIDYDKNITLSNIIQRRQTANIPANQNLMAMAKFVSFYDNRIKTFDVDMISPLADDALDSYDYKIIGKSLIDTSYVYLIEVIPTTRLFPAFQGTIKILEGSYNLIEADLRPSDNTKIPFLDSLTFKEKFASNSEGIWYPAFLEISGIAKVNLLAGLYDFDINANATSIYSEVKINQPLPDSIYKADRPMLITVDSSADSSNPKFWENNSLRELTPLESRVYTLSDSIAKLREAAPEISNFRYSYFPYLDYNRVGSFTAGLSVDLFAGPLELNLTPRYSIGQNRWFGESELAVNIFANRQLSLQAGVGVYSKISEQGIDKPYPRLYNSISSVIDRWDYYDYMQTDGEKVFIRFDDAEISAEINLRSERQFSLDSVEGFSLFKETNFRSNPVIKEGNFNILDGKFQYGNINLLFLPDNFDYEVDLNFFLCNLRNSSGGTLGAKGYGGIGGSVITSIPLLKTGYKPITMTLLLKAGLQTDDSPTQFLFRMPARLMVINKFGSMYSASPQEFGGAEYYGIYCRLNLSDIWWRFLSLPTFDGRGIDLNLAAGTEQYKANNSISYLRQTGDDEYSEIGFGLSRIPTFISNVAFLSFDARWGIGPVASGRFGWGLSVSLPF